jgi:hypothetical protein
MCSFLALVPLLTLARLAHLGIALLVRILRRAGRTDDRCVHDRAGAQLQPSGLQHLADGGEQLLAQIVVLQQAAKLQQRGAVGHALAPQIDTHEAAQRGAVQQRFFAGLVGQVEPVLHEVHAQHALQPHGRAPVARLGVVQFDQLTQLAPRHDLVHRGKEHIAIGRSAVPLESTALFGRHGPGLLLHRATTHRRVDRCTCSALP